jgi:hypothetical protein
VSSLGGEDVGAPTLQSPLRQKKADDQASKRAYEAPEEQMNCVIKTGGVIEYPDQYHSK